MNNTISVPSYKSSSSLHPYNGCNLLLVREVYTTIKKKKNASISLHNVVILIKKNAIF